MEEKHKHRVTNLPGAMYGGALDRVSEDDEGKLWVDNSEYSSQVNYCPICGFKAKVQVEVREDKDL